jgi:hypothetical protein
MPIITTDDIQDCRRMFAKQIDFMHGCENFIKLAAEGYQVGTDGPHSINWFAPGSEIGLVQVTPKWAATPLGMTHEAGSYEDVLSYLSDLRIAALAGDLDLSFRELPSRHSTKRIC